MSTRQQAASNSEGIDNFQLPKALVTRIAKSVLPHDAKLQKDTINALANGATVFINYLAATAQDVASSRSRKTIAGPDILKALEIIDFGDLVPLLEGELDGIWVLPSAPKESFLDSHSQWASFPTAYRGIGKTDKGKGKASDVKAKGKEKEPLSVAASGILDDMQPGILYSAGEGHDGEHEYEDEGGPAAEMLENVKEREEGGNDEDVGLAGAEAEGQDEDEEEQEEQQEEEEEEEEEEEGDEDVEDDMDEPEEVVDMLAIEETELQKDQQGLEESARNEEE